MARLVRAYRMILSIAIAQTQTEQASSPSMTTLTIHAACRNSAISDTSLEAIGKADCATSAGFISGILSTQLSQICREQMPVPQPHDRRGGKRQRESLVVSHGGPVQKPRPASPANVSKRGLFARPYPHNQALIMVNVWLPKGILAAANGGNGTGRARGIGFQTPYQAKPPICGQMGGRVAVRFVGGTTPEALAWR